jgi:hypothetical protein
MVENSGLPQVTMLDLNGDGLPNRLMARFYGDGQYKTIFTRACDRK